MNTDKAELETLDRHVLAAWRSGQRSPGAIWQWTFHADEITDVVESLARLRAAGKLQEEPPCPT